MEQEEPPALKLCREEGAAHLFTEIMLSAGRGAGLY